MFTKQHYEKIAKVLNSWYAPESDGKVYHYIHLHACNDFGWMLREDNPLFDFDRFMKACGHGDEE